MLGFHCGLCGGLGLEGELSLEDDLMMRVLRLEVRFWNMVVVVQLVLLLGEVGREVKLVEACFVIVLTICFDVVYRFCVGRCSVLIEVRSSVVWYER